MVIVGESEVGQLALEVHLESSLIWTLSSVPLVSGLEEFHCIMLRDVDTILCPNDGRADFPVNNILSVFSLVDVGAP